MEALTTTIRRDVDADVTVVWAHGLLNMVTAPLMRTTLLKCPADCPSAVVVDMSQCQVVTPLTMTVFRATTKRATQPMPAVLLVDSTGALLRHGGETAIGEIPVHGPTR